LAGVVSGVKADVGVVVSSGMVTVPVTTGEAVGPAAVGETASTVVGVVVSEMGVTTCVPVTVPVTTGEAVGPAAVGEAASAVVGVVVSEMGVAGGGVLDESPLTIRLTAILRTTMALMV
jgi:hypothetical protein